MSIQAMNYVRALKVGRSSDKFVLMCIANYADEEGFAYPSQKRLCDDTELDRKTIISSLASLVRAGHLHDTGSRKGATHQVIVYQILRPEVAERLNSPENGTVPNFPVKSPVFPAKQSRKRDTEPSLNLQEPSERARKRASPSKPSSEKGTKWSKDRAVPQDWIESAAAARRGAGMPDLDLRAEAAKFSAHWAATGGVRENWQAAFEKWCVGARVVRAAPQEAVRDAFEQTTVSGWRDRLKIFGGADEECPPGSWSPNWGPPPGADGCRVPADLLGEIGTRRAA